MWQNVAAVPERCTRVRQPTADTQTGRKTVHYGMFRPNSLKSNYYDFTVFFQAEGHTALL